MKEGRTHLRTRARARLLADLVRGFWQGLDPRVYLERDGTARAALVREVPLRLSRNLMSESDATPEEVWGMVRSALAARPSATMAVGVIQSTTDGVQVRQEQADLACAEIEILVDNKGCGRLQGKGLLRLHGCSRLLSWGGASTISHDVFSEILKAAGPPQLNTSRIKRCRRAIATADFLNAPGPLVLDDKNLEMRVQPVRMPFVLDDETFGGSDIWFLWHGLDHSLAVEPVIVSCNLLIMEDPADPEEVDVVPCLASVQGATIGLARLGPSIGPTGILVGTDSRIRGLRFSA